MAALNRLNTVMESADVQASLASDSMEMRDEFLKWLENGKVKKTPPQVAIECLDRISEYVISKKISCSIWEISNPSVYKTVYQKVMDAKLLRITQRDTYKVFTFVGQLYAKFLKEKPFAIKKAVAFIDEEKEEEAAIEFENIIREDINSDSVVAWLITQPNANGTLYLKNVARAYMGALRNAPRKLILEDSQNRNVFRCHTLLEFDELWTAFKASPNYTDVNRTLWHGQFSAGLAAYRRYMEHLEENGQPGKNAQSVVIASISQATKEIPRQLTAEPQHVDFAHHEFCTGCDPQTCVVEGKSFCSHRRHLLKTLHFFQRFFLYLFWQLGHGDFFT